MVGSPQSLLAMGESGGGPRAELELLSAARAGDGDALEQLVRDYKQPLFALCYGILGHPEDAEDAVQETFLRVLRALPGFRGDASFRTWLLRIAVNLCLNWKRDRRAAAPWDEERPGGSPAAASPERIALSRLQIMEALSQLPPRHRVIFLLKVLEGWSVAEISVAVGWNPIRVKNELSKARRTLAEWQARGAGEGAEP
jgi:RNA polymerase sigma-70 factor, ECF subfamily